MFPYREHDGRFKSRPAIVLDNDEMSYLSAQVTSEFKPYYGSPEYYIIQDWKHAGLLHPSVAHLSQTEPIPETQVIVKLGHLSEKDVQSVLKNLKKLGK